MRGGNLPRSAVVLAVLVAAPAAAEGPPVTCLIEPAETIQLSTAVAGVVSETHVDRGDRVAAGDVVARLDSQVEAAAVALARARADNPHGVATARARLDFLLLRAERNEQLAARNALSRSAADESAMEVAVAREELAAAELARDLAALELAEAEARLSLKTLRSPVDGVVTERLMGVGEYRNEQSHLVTIVRLDPLRVEVFAPISLYGRVRVGDRATVRPEAPVGGAHEATVTVVDPVLDPATGTFGLRLELPNPDLTVPAGLRCEVEFHPPA